LHATADQYFSDWEAPRFGMPRASLLALVIVVCVVSFFFWLQSELATKPVPPSIQVTQATLTTLPRPTPPPPPKVVPQPPTPAVIPKPAPVPSKVVVATKPPPPVHHVPKPVPHPVVNHAPPTPAPVSQTPQPPAPAPTDGIRPYGIQMYNVIQANQDVPPALAQLGVSGTAVVEITVAPDGHILSAKVIKSSGVPIIDQTALQHAEQAKLPPFNDQMPQAPHVFDIPIEIQPNTDQ
jgi:TonB family protein